MNVQSCTVNGNQANGTVLGEGGGIYSYGSVLTLVASTVKGNKATTAYPDIYKAHEARAAPGADILSSRRIRNPSHSASDAAALPGVSDKKD